MPASSALLSYCLPSRFQAWVLVHLDTCGMEHVLSIYISKPQFVHLFNRYVLSIYSVSGNSQQSLNTSVNITDKDICQHGAGQGGVVINDTKWLYMLDVKSHGVGRVGVECGIK